MNIAEFFINKRSVAIAIFSIAFMFTLFDKAQADMSKPTIACALLIQSPQQLSNRISLTFSITNPYNEEVKLLTWYTPFEGFLSNLFIIKNLETNKELNYQGPMVKRGQPNQDDYLLLSAIKSAVTEVNLVQGYQLTKGRFSLQLKQTTMKFSVQDNQLTNINCSSETILFEIH